MKKHIPNLFTFANLCCGLLAIMFALRHELDYAAFLVFLGIFFDFFDGLAARLLKVESELGVQLDSLADLVTSGVVPGFVMMQLLASSIGSTAISGEWVLASSFVPYIALLIPIASAYRLAKFNIDEEQKDSFIGLPTPANAVLILSLPLIIDYQFSELSAGIIHNYWFLIGLTLLSTFLLNAPIQLFALKFKSWGFKENAVRYIFIALCAILLVLLKFVAIPVIIISYIFLSLFSKSKKG